MRTSSIYLVSKKSFYEVYGVDRQDPDFLAMMDRNQKLSHRLRSAHRENLAAVEAVEAWLTKQGIRYEKGPPGRQGVDGCFDLVVSVGGDGTLLSTSHSLVETPVVGVNSRPDFSVGYFCAAHTGNLPERLGEVFEGKVPLKHLRRIRLQVNGRTVGPPALNDFLYSASNPAASTVYTIRMEDREELQKGSGIWVATPAGSSAAILAAGGSRIPLETDLLQYLVREIFRRTSFHYRLLRGTFREGLKIMNLTPEASLYVDGGGIEHRLCYGDEICPGLSPHPLKIHL